MRILMLPLLLIFTLTAEAQDITRGTVKTPDDSVYVKVDKKIEYPGGPESWQRFVERVMRYPEKAMKNEIRGTVIVEFIVAVDGSLSDIKAISGPEEGGLREEAMRVVKLSKKWKPAMLDGRKVKSSIKQPIVFILSYN